MGSVYRCASAQTASKLQTTAPKQMQNIYYQRWNAGVKESGYGVDVYVNITDNTLVLDSVYFRNKVAKLKLNTKKNVYVGSFKTPYSPSEDTVISSNPNEELQNKITLPKPKIPFDLQANECVITTKENGKTRYYKISNLVEKEALNFPAAPPKNH